MVTELRAVLFDIDGTLAETERHGHRVAFNAAFEEAGLDWHWDPNLYGELLAITGGKERIRHYIDHYRPDFSPGKGDRETQIAALHQAKNRHYARLVEEGAIPLRPGVLRLLQEARQTGLRLAIATTTSRANVEALLTHCVAPDALSWFEVIGAGDEVEAKKPAPDIFHHVLASMALAPAAALALEDSGNGVKAAVGAGVPTVVTVSDYAQQDDFDGALLVVDHLGEPDQPCRALAGDLDDYRYLDVAALRDVHAQLGNAQ